MTPYDLKPPVRDTQHQPKRQAGTDLQARYERSLALARARETAGDKVDAERFYQQADHYRRLLNSKAA